MAHDYRRDGQDRERAVHPYTKDLERSEQCIGWIEAVNARITKYITEARQLAMGNDNDPRRQGLDVNVKHTNLSSKHTACRTAARRSI